MVAEIPTKPHLQKLKKHSKNYENKIDEYYQNSILNRYKYSGISEEANILTNELLKTSKYNLKNISKQIISYSGVQTS